MDSAGVKTGQLMGNLDLPGQEHRHVERGRDWFTILLLVLSALALLATIAITIYAILQRFFPGLQPLIPAEFVPINGPFGLETTLVVQLGLLLLSLTLYFVARKRILDNRSLQAVAGCPSCREHDLLRVRRKTKDRLLTLSGVRVARYECRNCTWGGLRVYTGQPYTIRTPYPANELVDETGMVPDEMAAIVMPKQAAKPAPMMPRQLSSAEKDRAKAAPAVESPAVVAEMAREETAAVLPTEAVVEPVLAVELDSADTAEFPAAAALTAVSPPEFAGPDSEQAVETIIGAAEPVTAVVQAAESRPSEVAAPPAATLDVTELTTAPAPTESSVVEKSEPAGPPVEPLQPALITNNKAATVAIEAASEVEAAPVETIVSKRRPKVVSEDERRLEATESEWRSKALVAGQRAKIAASLGLNLRAEPRESAELVGLLGPDAVVMLLSEVHYSDGLAWQQVETRTKRGWVLNSFLEPIE